MSERTHNWKRWLRRGGLGLLGLMAAAGAVYWLALRPVPVQRYEVSRGTVVAEVMGTGTLQPRVQAVIGPEIGGRIEAVAVDQGDEVAAGDLLVKLADDDLQRQVAGSKADVDRAEAALRRTEAELAQSRAALNQAQLEHDHLERLLERDAATQLEYARAAEALAVARAGRDRADAALNEAEKQLIAAKQTWRYRQARLEKATIIAPFAGRIVQRERDPGDVVAAGARVLELASTEQRWWVRAWVDESELAQLAPDQPARIVFRAEPNETYEGTVDRVGLATDTQTRQLLVDVTVRELPAHWAVGQRAEVYIETDRRERVTTIPREAMLWRDGEPGVWRLNDAGRSRWRSVELGLVGRDCVEVRTGLRAGEQVVRLNGETRLTSLEGRKVVAQ